MESMMVRSNWKNEQPIWFANLFLSNMLIGKPRYVERNKEDGAPFRSTIPAEIIYCQDAESWVLRHEKIRTDINTDDKVSRQQMNRYVNT